MALQSHRQGTRKHAGKSLDVITALQININLIWEENYSNWI